MCMFCLLVCLVAALAAVPAATSARPKYPLVGPVIKLAPDGPGGQVLPQDPLEPAPELPAARERRRQRIVERRAGTVLMVRRGATALAPENSLAASAAAMDYGADGVAVDIRMTRDGVPVLFADQTLDRLTDGFGLLAQFTYRELLPLQRQAVGGPPRFSHLTTFAALLDLARDRDMLLWLNLDAPGLDREVARLLDAADAWELVIGIHSVHPSQLGQHLKFHPLSTKAQPRILAGGDLDPTTVAGWLAQPGQVLLVGDPRVAVRALGRSPFQPRPLTETFILTTRPLALPPDPADHFNPLAHIRALANRINPRSTDSLVALLVKPPALASPVSPPWAREQRIVERAWAAGQLGSLGRRSGGIVAALEQTVQEPVGDGDPLYRGVEVAAVARALGRLGATESVPVLLAAWRKLGDAAADASDSVSPAAGERVQIAILEALGDLRCRTSRRFLTGYLETAGGASGSPGPSYVVEATRALLRQRLDWAETAALLRSPNPEVWGTTVLECLDQFTEERGQALRAAAPWALELPRPGR